MDQKITRNIIKVFKITAIFDTVYILVVPAIYCTEWIKYHKNNLIGRYIYIYILFFIFIEFSLKQTIIKFKHYDFKIQIPD